MTKALIERVISEGSVTTRNYHYRMVVTNKLRIIRAPLWAWSRGLNCESRAVYERSI